jgi:hypothetical protein
VLLPAPYPLSQADTNRLTFDVSVIVISSAEAGEQFVQTAKESPEDIGDLVTNLASAGAILDEVSQPCCQPH